MNEGPCISNGSAITPIGRRKTKIKSEINHNRYLFIYVEINWNKQWKERKTNKQTDALMCFSN